MVTSYGISRYPIFRQTHPSTKVPSQMLGHQLRPLAHTKTIIFSAFLMRKANLFPNYFFCRISNVLLKASESRPFAHAGVEWHARMVFWELMAIHTHHSPRFPQLPQPPCRHFLRGATGTTFTWLVALNIWAAQERRGPASWLGSAMKMGRWTLKLWYINPLNN